MCQWQAIGMDQISTVLEHYQKVLHCEHAYGGVYRTAGDTMLHAAATQPTALAAATHCSASGPGPWLCLGCD